MNLSNVVLVVGANEESKALLQRCRAARPGMGGFVDCADPHASQNNRQLCETLASHPAVCDQSTNACTHSAVASCSAEEISSLVQSMRTRLPQPNQ